MQLCCKLELFLISQSLPCRSGIRTVCSCSHRTALVMLLCATECLDTAKMPEALLVDTAR